MSRKFYKTYEDYAYHTNKYKRERTARDREKAFNGGSSWTPDEIELIMTSNLTLTELTKKIGRTSGAIMKKRYLERKHHE